jgi:hypothetical protein
MEVIIDDKYGLWVMKKIFPCCRRVGDDHDADLSLNEWRKRWNPTLPSKSKVHVYCPLQKSSKYCVYFSGRKP